MADLPLKPSEARLAAADIFKTEGIPQHGVDVNGVGFHDAVPREAEPEPREAPQAAPAEPTRPKPLDDGQKAQHPREETREAPAYQVPQPDPLPAALQSHHQEVRSQVSLLQQEAAQIQQLPPGDRVAAEQNLRMKARRLENYARQVTQATQQHQQSANEGYMNRVSAEVLKTIPEWSDPAVRRSEAAQLKRWLHGRGYSDADLSKLRDPRALRDLHSLWQADSGVRTPTKRRQQRSRKAALDAANTKARRVLEQRGYTKESQLEAVSTLLRSL